MICKYIVLAEVPKILMVLRPYQYHAIEAIIDRVENSDKNGYIWHTTGCGKTLTSFKTSQILMNLPHVDKVVFVVIEKIWIIKLPKNLIALVMVQLMVRIIQKHL